MSLSVPGIALTWEKDFQKKKKGNLGKKPFPQVFCEMRVSEKITSRVTVYFICLYYLFYFPLLQH